jgi:hypothetical protein
MRVFELDISWAATASERRHLQWELLAREEVRGVFLTARDDVLAVLFASDRGAFDAWAGTLEPGRSIRPEIARGGAVIRRRASLPLLFLGAMLVLVPWSGWLVISLPCRYLSRHWGIAWAGFDAGLAVALGLTGLAALRRAAWLDRAAVAAGTLLAADAWFDVLTSHGADAVALAATEALAIELPLACLCIWLAHAIAQPRAHDSSTAMPTTQREGAI